jgi:hypothetical protein
MIAAIVLALVSAGNDTDRAMEVTAPVVVVRDTAWFSGRTSNVSMVVESKSGEFIAKDWKTVGAKKPDDVLLPCMPCEAAQ